MEYCRLQIGCLLIIVYIGFIYFRECKRYHKKLSSSIFDEILILSALCVIFDGVTAVTVNYLESVNPIINKALHLIFLIGIDTVIYMMSGYTLKMTGAISSNREGRIFLHLPYIINVLIVVIHIGDLEFRHGTYTNYSMGVSAYTCFAMVGIYVLFTLVVFFRRWNYIEGSKRISVLTYLLTMGGITLMQAICI